MVVLNLGIIGSQQFKKMSLKRVATHSSTLAWKIPWTEEPGGLQSMGSRRVGHDRATSLSLFTFLLWRRKWQSTPVFLPGESQGWGSLVGCCLWGHTESDTTEVTQRYSRVFSLQLGVSTISLLKKKKTVLFVSKQQHCSYRKIFIIVQLKDYPASANHFFLFLPK